MLEQQKSVQLLDNYGQPLNNNDDDDDDDNDAYC